MAKQKFAFSVATLSLLAIAIAQDGEFKKSSPKQLPPTEAPVTKTEAATVFTKVESSIRSALKMPKANSAYAKGDTAISKAEVLQAFEKWRKVAEPKFQIRPRTVRTQVPLQSTEPLLAKLVAQGFVAKNGPIAPAKGTTLKPAELGDAIGFFLARLSEHTQTPSTKFTPYLRTVDSDF